MERFRDAMLNHDEFLSGWLAEANDELTTLREERASLRRRVAELEQVIERARDFDPQLIEGIEDRMSAEAAAAKQKGDE